MLGALSKYRSKFSHMAVIGLRYADLECQTCYSDDYYTHQIIHTLWVWTLASW